METITINAVRYALYSVEDLSSFFLHHPSHPLTSFTDPSTFVDFAIQSLQRSYVLILLTPHSYPVDPVDARVKPILENIFLSLASTS